jgi:hypothetical protein
MNIQTAYRIVEVKNGNPYTLFHGLPNPLFDWPNNGAKRSREIFRGIWLKADKKLVRDGTGPYYLSGFNVLLTREGLEKYMERFTALRELRIVEIEVRGELRPKEHSRSEVWLADEMRLKVWPQE